MTAEDIKTQDAGRSDTAKLVVGIVLLAAGVAGYYVLGGDAAWLRWIAVVAGLVVAGILLAFSRYGTEFNEFVVSARVELRKIVWPNRQETGMTTLIVFVFVAIAGFFFWGLDLLLSWATRALTGTGG